MKTGFTFSLGWAAKPCGLPSGHTVGIPASATVSLLALSTAVPRSRTSANTESFISLTLATAWPGLYASSLTTTRSLRPFTPPAALTCLAQASAASEIDPHAAAGPERGAVIPSTTSLSVTPGAAARSNAASSMSGLLRGGRSIAHSGGNRQRTRKEIVKPRRIGPRPARERDREGFILDFPEDFPAGGRRHVLTHRSSGDRADRRHRAVEQQLRPDGSAQVRRHAGFDRSAERLGDPGRTLAEAACDLTDQEMTGVPLFVDARLDHCRAQVRHASEDQSAESIGKDLRHAAVLDAQQRGAGRQQRRQERRDLQRLVRLGGEQNQIEMLIPIVRDHGGLHRAGRRRPADARHPQA